MRDKIIAAAKEERKHKDYPTELQLECIYIQDKLDNAHGPYPHLDRK